MMIGKKLHIQRSRCGWDYMRCRFLQEHPIVAAQLTRGNWPEEWRPDECAWREGTAARPLWQMEPCPKVTRVAHRAGTRVTRWFWWPFLGVLHCKKQTSDPSNKHNQKMMSCWNGTFLYAGLVYTNLCSLHTLNIHLLLLEPHTSTAVNLSVVRYFKKISSC
jgi:hypothetical protein